MENIKLNFAHICENVILDKNGNLSIINIFNQINAVAFPAVHPKMVIIIGVGRIESKEEERCSLKIKISPMGEIMDVIPEVNKDIEFNKGVEEVRFFANFSPVVFPKAGFYEVSVSVSGASKRNIRFEVKSS